jgi:hypothetical protein
MYYPRGQTSRRLERATSHCRSGVYRFSRSTDRFANLMRLFLSEETWSSVSIFVYQKTTLWVHGHVASMIQDGLPNPTLLFRIPPSPNNLTPPTSLSSLAMSAPAQSPSSPGSAPVPKAVLYAFPVAVWSSAGTADVNAVDMAS